MLCIRIHLANASSARNVKTYQAHPCVIHRSLASHSALPLHGAGMFSDPAKPEALGSCGAQGRHQAEPRGTSPTTNQRYEHGQDLTSLYQPAP